MVTHNLERSNKTCVTMCKCIEHNMCELLLQTLLLSRCLHTVSLICAIMCSYRCEDDRRTANLISSQRNLKLLHPEITARVILLNIFTGVQAFYARFNRQSAQESQCRLVWILGFPGFHSACQETTWQLIPNTAIITCHAVL